MKRFSCAADAITLALVLAGTLTFCAPSWSAGSARDAFSAPDESVTDAQQLEFRIGQNLFERLWVSAPASTQAADGLGPLYNARACVSCHPRNGRGLPPHATPQSTGALFLRIDIPPQTEEERQALASHRLSNIPDPVYGLQLQDLSISGVMAEYSLKVNYHPQAITLADGSVVELQVPTYHVARPGYGPLHPQARLSPRIAQQMIGLGLLQAIPEAELRSREDPDDRDGNGISGRANRVWSRTLNQTTLGRFGHKAGTATVREQVHAAFSGDIGISTSLFPAGAGECTARQTECMQAPDGNSPQYDNLEAPPQVTSLTTYFSSNLAVPAPRNSSHPDFAKGKALFQNIGCNGCHIASYRVHYQGRERTFSPYTDLLLHDMGEGLADHRPEAGASGTEWRTPPLWGIGLTRSVSGGEAYLHDGRARTLLEAILWHGGEAQHQRDHVVSLPQQQREQLLFFIKNL
jgi:CxxC motif-containing protein (DUF1111 family)